MTEVVAALIWDQDKFMICQRPAHKARGLLWEFVGGKVEPGETKEQALIRECQEELAITLDVGEVFMDVTHEYPDLTVHLTLFHATIQEGVPQKLEHNDIRWITVNEIDQFMFCPADEDTQVNKAISDDAPCDYFSKAFMQCETKAIELGNICNLSQLNENLQENCIPLSVKNMDASSYEEFLTERRKLMASMMKRYYWSL